MHVNDAQRSIVCKICVHGAPESGQRELLETLYNHYAAVEGEHTKLEVLEFEPASELPEATRAGFVATAEESFGAPYDDLVDAGTLVWFRARVRRATSPAQYDVFADVFTVVDADTDALHQFAQNGADALLFVADIAADGPDETLRAWQQLGNAPTVVYTHGSDAEVTELLEHGGVVVSNPEPLYGALEAFETAVSLAARRAREAN